MNGRLNQDNDELLKCPACQALYKPDYSSKYQSPKGSVGRLQWETGLCSRACELSLKNGGSLR
jgi:hypothetical protein